MLRASVVALCLVSWCPQASQHAFVPANTSRQERHHNSNQSWRLLQSSSSGGDELVVQNGAKLEQIICVVNLGSVPKPASSISYEVGVVQSDSASLQQETMNAHGAMLSLAAEYGFSVVASVSMSASLSFDHQETTTTSHVTSSTLSETLTLNVPEVDSHSMWCAYRLEWQDRENSAMKFMFTDILVADARLEMTGAEITIRGTLQTWDDTRGYLLWTRAWPRTWPNGDNGWLPYMQNSWRANVRGWQGDPGLQGHWLFTARDDGSFLLAPKRWPSWYMYMQDHEDANVRGWGGDPGPAGHFIVTRHQVKSCFLISPKKWPRWYIYMQNNDHANIRGWEGPPGDQGCWQMQPAYHW